MLQHRHSAFALVVSLLMIGACSSTSSGGSDSVATTSVSDSTTSALIDGVTTAPAPGTSAVSLTTVAATTPATSPPATSPPTTKPPTTAAPATAPPATAAPGPKILSFSMVPSGNCGVPPDPNVSFTVPVTNPPTLKITWAATAADSVYVAVDNKDGVYAQDLPLAGSYELNFSCGGTHTYWVVAVKGGAKDYKSMTFA